ncbi:MAG TPA: hypothetical protein VNQ79_23005 [Blastocatellia bacterium]|nr:hypothetical protein [Blastocatellia bacterium]
MTSHKLTQMFLALAALVMMAMSALAADPGVVVSSNIVSDQKAGSVLIYNLYASSSTDPSKENTRINITNTNDSEGTFVHLFFVDGNTCAVADSFICLSKSQTTSILASDVDPDIRGYIVAVTVNRDGTPSNFNYLIGDEYVKLASGHAANLGAEALEAHFGGRITAPGPSSDTTYGLNFNGVQYDALPRVLALDNIASPKDGNDTLLIVNSVRGNLASGIVGAGSIFGILFDELESGYSFSVSGGCQLRASLSDAFPRTTPRLTNVIPAGSTGWMKFWAVADRAILGAAINKNTSTGATSFNGGHNLHKLTFTTTAIFDMPVFTAMCS